MSSGNNSYSLEAIAYFMDFDEDKLSELVNLGIIPLSDDGQYDFGNTITAYWTYVDYT